MFYVSPVGGILFVRQFKHGNFTKKNKKTNTHKKTKTKTKKKTGKSADYCRLLVEWCSKQIVANRTPPAVQRYLSKNFRYFIVCWVFNKTIIGSCLVTQSAQC